MTISAALLELYRTDFPSFAQRAFYVLNGDEKLDWNWHNDVICDRLNGVQSGKFRRHIVLIPPRSLKSFLCTIAWPAFLLGQRPSTKIIAVSYAQSLADDHARLAIALMTSDFYKAVFPATKLVSSKPATERFFTTEGGYRMATSVNGTLTGLGAEFIVIDDPIKAEEAASEAIRNAVNTWFGNTLRTRLNSREFGRIVLVMQRIHQNDLAGMLIERGWPVLKLAAIAPADEEHHYETIAGPVVFRRPMGGLLHPERDPQWVYDEIKADIGSYAFAAQFEQDPQSLEGNIVKRAWYPYYDPAAPVVGRIIQSWDTAGKTKESNDFSVCSTWELMPDKLIRLRHVLRKKLDQPALKAAIIDQANLYQAEVVLIEDTPVATGLIQDLMAERFYKLKPILPKGDKRMRLVAVSTMIENGFIHLPEKGPWLDEYLDEVTGFPGAKYDDQVDSTTQALAWIREQGQEPAITTYYREEVEALARKNVPSVRFRVPPGTNPVGLMDGTWVHVGADGCVVVSPYNAPALRAAGFVEVPPGQEG